MTFFNLVLVISHYAEVRYWSNWRNYLVYGDTGTGSDILKEVKFFVWQDIALIVCSLVLFLAYIGAYKIPSTRLKYLRALMILVPTVLMLFVGINYVHLVLKINYPILRGPPTPFNCSYLSGLERAYCGVIESNYFFAILTGLFAVFEICLTVKNGPMQPKNEHSYGPNGEYVDDANSVIVEPSEYSMSHLQNPYTYRVQPVISPQQFSPFIAADQLILLSSPEYDKTAATITALKALAFTRAGI
ncbi:hypothetical protein BGZ97_003341 [Linnemannia gamsii]|uniref:Uncharacterized protein n=1 Tax=Linnemannia gamsii TaxID=64522 RepID=A0A9P6QX97_9FUNG|nr:hypothetical protein BGZ97_003341 [Linnemannia gamsii]